MLNFIKTHDRTYKAEYKWHYGLYQIKIEYHYGHSKWMITISSFSLNKNQWEQVWQEYHCDSREDAMERSLALVSADEYRIVTEADLALEDAILLDD